MNVTASDARANLYKLLEHVNDEDEVVTITHKGRTVHLVGEAEFGSLREMTHLLGRSANGRRLYQALEDAEQRRNLVTMDSEDALELLERAIGAAENMQPKSA